MEYLDFEYLRDKDSKIVLYGTYKMQLFITDLLQAYGISVYKYANEKGTYASPYNNLSLVELAQLNETEKIIIILADNEKIRFESNRLEKAGISKLYSIRKLWQDVDQESLKKNTAYKPIINRIDNIFFFEDSLRNPQKCYVPSLDAVVTERCSLKCAGCSNLMQYYVNPKHRDIDELITNIDLFLEKVDQLLALCILGGEPFMNPEFIKLVDHFKDEKKIRRIEIITNATIFPDAEILEHLKFENVFFRISDYDELSKKLPEWEQWCEENRLAYDISQMLYWQDCGHLERRDYTEQELRDVYGNCDCRALPTIFGNRIYNCPYAANASNLGAMYQDEKAKDYLELTNETTAEEIDRFLFERPYLQACKYCSGRNSRRARIKPHVQAKQPLEYTKLEHAKFEKKAVVKEAGNEEKSLSIVVPVYNCEKYVEQCLKSLIDQTYQNLEIILVDDGSTDGSLQICKKLIKDNSNRKIFLIENEHAGVVTARNTGIMQATGDYLAFVDADDWVDLDYFEKMMQQTYDCDLVFSGYTKVDEDKAILDLQCDRGQAIYELYPQNLLCGIFEGMKIAAFRSRLFEDIVERYVGYIWSNIFVTKTMQSICGQIDPEIHVCEDELLLHLYVYQCNKINCIKEYGYYYRSAGFNMRHNWTYILKNHELCHKIRREAVEKIPNHTKLREEADFYYMTAIKGEIQKQVGASSVQKRYYYPYFGRLSGKRVVLYGAGNVGKWYYREMREEADSIIVTWVDKNAKLLRENECLPVEDVDVISNKEFDYLIVAVYDKDCFEKIKENLKMTYQIPDEKIIWNPTKVEI